MYSKWFIALFLFIGIQEMVVAQKSNKLIVATYNLRYNNPQDGINAWPNRVNLVKGLIQFHDWDIFGTQEVLYNQIQDLEALSEYGWIGVGRDDGSDDCPDMGSEDGLGVRLGVGTEDWPGSDVGDRVGRDDGSDDCPDMGSEDGLGVGLGVGTEDWPGSDVGERV